MYKLSLVDRLEVLFGSLRFGLHGLLAWLPICRAHLAVLIGELKGLHES